MSVALSTPHNWQARLHIPTPEEIAESEQFSDSDDEDDSNDKLAPKPMQCRLAMAHNATPSSSRSNGYHQPPRTTSQLPHAPSRPLPQTHPTPVKANSFVTALANSAMKYSQQLRVPAVQHQPTPTTKARRERTQAMVDWGRNDHQIQDTTEDESSSSTNPSTDDLNSEQMKQFMDLSTSKWARYSGQPIDNVKEISKLGVGAMCEVYIKQGTISGKPITYISKTWMLSRKWEGFFSELAIYSHPRYLRDLQGKVIPKVIGVYLGDGCVCVNMELPHSSFWVEASDEMPDPLKWKCVEALDKIHERGVLHNDVELRHTLINGRGDVIIIDFQQSKARHPDEDLGLRGCTLEEIRLEKRKLRFKLNLDNAVHKEGVKMERVRRLEGENLRRRIKGLPLLPMHPDDIKDPVVDPQTWTDCWVGERFDPRCFIVPGQDCKKVNAALREFAIRTFFTPAAPVPAHMHASTSRLPMSAGPGSPQHPSPVVSTPQSMLKRSRDDECETSYSKVDMGTSQKRVRLSPGTVQIKKRKGKEPLIRVAVKNVVKNLARTLSTEGLDSCRIPEPSASAIAIRQNSNSNPDHGDIVSPRAREYCSLLASPLPPGGNGRTRCSEQLTDIAINRSRSRTEMDVCPEIETPSPTSMPETADIALGSPSTGSRFSTPPPLGAEKVLSGSEDFPVGSRNPFVTQGIRALQNRLLSTISFFRRSKGPYLAELRKSRAMARRHEIPSVKRRRTDQRRPGPERGRHHVGVTRGRRDAWTKSVEQVDEGGNKWRVCLDKAKSLVSRFS